MEYKEIIDELEKIVERLESGDCGLEESAKLFERGTELAKMLGKTIDDTKGKITIIKNQLDKIIEEDFE